MEFEVAAEVRKPAVTSADSSGDVKLMPDIEIELGLAFIMEMYFAFVVLAIYGLVMSGCLPLRSFGSWSCDCTSACHSRTEASPSPTAAAPTPRCGIVTRRKIPALASSAISRSMRVGDVLSESICAMVTKGGNLLRKFKTSAIRVEFMPAFSGISLNILFRMYSIYCGTSRKFRSSASEAITPVSSSCSSSSYRNEVSEGKDRLFELAVDGDEVFRFSPNAAAALVLRGVLMRDERAGVAWKDISMIFSF